MSKLRLNFLIILIIFSFFQCQNDNPVPEVYVNFTLELSNPLYQPLGTIGNAIYLENAGNKGIIVIQTDLNVFSAYDATCTYDPDDEWGRVEIEANGIFATDTKCGSQFSLMMNGYVNVGPAEHPLQYYPADYNPNLRTLHIHN